MVIILGPSVHVLYTPSCIITSYVLLCIHIYIHTVLGTSQLYMYCIHHHVLSQVMYYYVFTYTYSLRNITVVHVLYTPSCIITSYVLLFAYTYTQS